LEFENLLNNPLAVAAIAVVVGLGIGSLLTYLLIGRGPSKTELTGKLSAVEEEFAAHKQSVDKHFETTSELVNDLTESYAKVYKHLSQGAEQLSGVVDMRHRLTVDDTDREPSIDGEKPVLEGAIAAGAGALAGAAADTADHVDDPQFTVSDAAVEETLIELEASATDTAESAAENAADVGDAKV